MGYSPCLIIVCSSCQAQYSVPDAKIQGRKVRVTCKHCGNGIIVDGLTQPAAPTFDASTLASLAALASSTAPSDERTRLMGKGNDFSVHDEPTVVGRIPQEALDAERRFSQRTVPPPKATSVPAAPLSPPPAPPAAVVVAPGALPEDVPEKPLDTTQVASPQALRVSRTSLPPVASAEVKTLLSRREAARKVSWPWMLAALAALALVGLLLLTRTR